MLIGLEPGQRLGDHQVKEAALLVVVDGGVEVEAARGARVGRPGTVFRFDPDERHSVSSASGAQLLLVLAPWPGRRALPRRRRRAGERLALLLDGCGAPVRFT